MGKTWKDSGKGRPAGKRVRVRGENRHRLWGWGYAPETFSQPPKRSGKRAQRRPDQQPDTFDD